ncbi:MAG: mandelate racemase/muconate lactonizing enzyme family protein [Chloroflexi bacterium]|nr:mandelate racemase/muconate lactonizing enzyme family protein [Chloroflexota bacterium]
MKIKEVKVSVVSTGVPLFAGRDQEMLANLVQIITDDGIEGDYFAWEGPISGRGFADTVAYILRPELIGQDPMDRERIWQRMLILCRQGVPMMAAGAVDVALWDIAGKAAGVPIYKLLGGYRDKLRTYASSPTFPDAKQYVDLAMDLQSRGYTAMKIHVRGDDPRRHLEACTAVRKAVGPDFDLMIDCHAAYDRTTALKVGQELERLNFYWMEEPIVDTDLEGLADLCRTLIIPIAAGESLYQGNPAHFVPYITMGAADIIRSDARRGITLVKKLADTCDTFGLKCEPHSWGSVIGQAANLHIMGAIRNCDFFEKAVPENRFDVCQKEGINIDKDGNVSLPQKPGLGVELDWDEVKRRTMETL